ncbi:MAG: Flp family type IVb pilin [Sedimenticola sp.]
MKKLLQKIRRSQTGATMVEYGLMVALIAIVAIAAVTLVGQEVNETFDTVGTALETANENAGAGSGGTPDPDPVPGG